MEPLERLMRMAELNKISRRTAEQDTELRRLMSEHMAWATANPSKVAEVTTAFETLQRGPTAPAPATPARAPTSAAAAPPTGGRAPSPAAGRVSADVALEERRVAAGQAARARAISEGKSPAQADAIALEAYTRYVDTPASPPPAPGEDSFSQHYAAIGEALEEDYRDFALHMRDLADKGELVGADGKPLPMYSRERIAEMTIPELKTFAASNPRYANQFFPTPPAEVTASLAGTGRTGVGSRSGMVEVPPLPSGPAATPAPAAATPAPAAPSTAPQEDVHAEATMVGAGGGATPEKPAKPGFGDKVKDLSLKFGVPILEVLEAVGYQRGNINKPTQLDKKYQEKLEAQQREYMANLERERETREQSTYEKRIAAERAWQEQQAALGREADTAARREELSARERLTRMQLDAARAAARTGGATSIIPD